MEAVMNYTLDNDEVILFDAMRDAFIYGYAISNEMKEETENYFRKKEE